MPHPITTHHWHPTKNRAHSPNDYIRMSKAKAWFLCEQKHEWHGIISTAIKNGYPQCLNGISNRNSLFARFPELAQEWDPYRNTPSSPELILAENKSNMLFWWKCEKCNHHWKESIRCRVSSMKKYCKSCREGSKSDLQKSLGFTISIYNKKGNAISKYIPAGTIDKYQQAIHLAQSLQWKTVY